MNNYFKEGNEEEDIKTLDYRKRCREAAEEFLEVDVLKLAEKYKVTTIGVIKAIIRSRIMDFIK